ncbi:MAG: hypothetical protein ACFC03_02645 [Candidatus Malihini olakiniferum]
MSEDSKLMVTLTISISHLFCRDCADQRYRKAAATVLGRERDINDLSRLL